MPSSLLALQLWSLRHEFQADPVKTLRQVRTLGYDQIETAGSYGWSAAEWKERLAEEKLSVAGAHLGSDILFERLEEHIPFQKTVGNHRYILPSLNESERTPEGYRRLATQLNGAGKTLRPHGGSVFYHNHDFEFESLNGGISGYEILLAETDPILVGFQIDVYWVAFAGKDPLRFLMEHADRVGSIHAKQIRFSDRSEVSLEQGDIDFAPIVALAQEHGWPIAVEYEEDLAIEAVRRGAEHLRSLGA